jgi:tetratricopeptide (TPR) repeat protein
MMTVQRTTFLARFFFVVLSVLGGCTAGTFVESAKDPTYGQEPKRIFISVTVSPWSFYAPFHAQISRRLAACGITAAYFQRPPTNPNLEFDSKAEETLEGAKIAMIRRSAPDTILTMNETTDTYVNRGLAAIGYFLQLDDVQSGKPVWKGKASLAFRFGDPMAGGRSLADDVVDHLVADGVLSCGAAPQAATEPLGDCSSDRADRDSTIEACTALLQSAKLNSADRADAFVSRGDTYAAKGQYDRAIQDYDEAIRLVPDDAAAFDNRGIAYRAKGDDDRAFEDFDQALQLKPDLTAAYNNRGVVHRTKRQFDQAILDHDVAIILYPRYWQAFGNRGTDYLLKGDYDHAMQDYDEAIKLKPDSAYALNCRGIVYSHKKQYDRAVQDYDRAIELSPDYVEAFDNRGLTHLKMKSYDAATADYDMALKLRPKSARSLFGRGLAKRANGDVSGAAADVRMAEQLDRHIAEQFDRYDVGR